MPIALTHIGEDLIAAILTTLAQRQQLEQVKCERSGRSLAQDIFEADGCDLSPRFISDEAKILVSEGGLEYSCDGEQKVDVLCALGKRAIAFEAKLGEKLMSPAAFRRRFCGCCKQSAHEDARISGSAVAVLERKFSFQGQPILSAELGEDRLPLTQYWWLVIRHKVYDRWVRANDVPVTSARILLFDSLAKTYGSQQQFNDLVMAVVGSDFARYWQLPLS